jgi:hypothetical protein
MNKRIFQFRLILISVAAWLGWILTEMLRAFLYITRMAEAEFSLCDGYFLQKLGELLIAISLGLIFLLSQRGSREKLLGFISGARIALMAGGILNGLAWYALIESTYWYSLRRLWSMALMIIGLFIADVIKRVVEQSEERQLRYG